MENAKFYSILLPPFTIGVQVIEPGFWCDFFQSDVVKRGQRRDGYILTLRAAEAVVQYAMHGKIVILGWRDGSHVIRIDPSKLSHLLNVYSNLLTLIEKECKSAALPETIKVEKIEKWGDS